MQVCKLIKSNAVFDEVKKEKISSKQMTSNGEV